MTTPRNGDEPIRLLLVTLDDEYAAEVVVVLDAVDGFAITRTETVGDALAHLDGSSVDCVLSDHDLPDTDGVAFLQAVRAQYPTLPFVLLTSEGSEEAASRAISADVTEYLVRDRLGEQVDHLPTLLRNAVTYDRTTPSLHESRRQVERVLDASPNLVAVVRDGRYEYVNRQGAALLGVDAAADLVGTAVEESLPADERSLTPAVLSAVQAGERHVERLDATLRDAEGAPVPVEATAAHIQWDGAPAVVLICRDLTEQRTRERRRSDLEATLRSESEGHLVDYIFEESPLATAILDAEGNIVRANARAEAVLGLTRSDIERRAYDSPNWEIIDTEGNPIPSDELPFARARDTGEPVYDYEHGIVHPDGERRWLSVSVSPAITDRGREYFVAVMEDVTEETELRDELQQSERLHRTVLNNITDTVFITDDEGRFTYVCPNVNFVFGYRHYEVEEMESVDELLGSDPVPEDFEGGTIENVEHRVTDADGEEHVVLVTVRSVTIQGGTRLYSVRDVTERKRQETRFQAFVENFSDVMLVLDDDGTMRYVTPSVTRILGYDPDDLQGEDAFARIHPDDRAAVRATFEQLRTSEDRSPVDVEYRYRHADGSWRWLSSVGVRHTELADGDYLVNSRDVTDRVHREQRLRRLEESRSLALQAADAGIWEWDLRTDTVDWDESCERLYGLEPGEFEGTYEAFAARVHPDDLPMVEATLERAVARREPLSVRYRILRDDGGERWVDGRGVVLTDEAGDPERVLGVDVDITEREEYLRQLRVLDTVLRHNFRNDMNVIQGFAETIRATASDPVAGYADRIVAQSDHLLDVTTKERKITDVLASETNLERVDVTSTVRSAVRMARERYPDATVDCDIESAAGVAVTARTELVEAVVELVENAIEHSDGEPRVRVSASVTEETVDVVVSDDGPGIPAVERQLVTGQRDIEPLYHGEGLGLWLVTLVARRSNGTLHFEENDPRGATVRIRLHRAE